MCVYLSRNVVMFRTVKGECSIKHEVTSSPMSSLAC